MHCLRDTDKDGLVLSFGYSIVLQMVSLTLSPPYQIKEMLLRHKPLYTQHVASFTKEVNPQFAKCPLKTNGRLANLELSSLVREATDQQPPFWALQFQ